MKLRGFLILLAGGLFLVAPVFAQEAGGIGPLVGDTGTIALVGLLATCAEALTEGLIAPIFDKYKADTFWLQYLAWAMAGALVGLSGANLFGAILPPLVGVILTALIAGRGSNFLHDLFSATAKRAQREKLQHQILAGMK
jgi:hypothetical protein